MSASFMSLRLPQASRNHKRALGKRCTGLVLLVVTSLGLIQAAECARADSILPTGGSVISGSADIGTDGDTMTVKQSTNRAIINWLDFSVGQPNTVIFDQPKVTSATLNRVTGDTPSTIAGTVQANGQIYFVNPNGFALTPTGAVKVDGGFVASTLDIENNDFNAGRLNFTGKGASAAVSNSGKITTAVGGFVGLLGGHVSNSGSIVAPIGKVGLGSGERAALDLSGDAFLQVALPTRATTTKGKALVDVSGKVKVAGGRFEIKAAMAAQALRDAVNVSGSVSASSFHMEGGSIVLDGGQGGRAAVARKVRINLKAGHGGTISVAGQ